MTEILLCIILIWLLILSGLTYLSVYSINIHENFISKILQFIENHDCKR